MPRYKTSNSYIKFCTCSSRSVKIWRRKQASRSLTVCVVYFWVKQQQQQQTRWKLWPLLYLDVSSSLSRPYVALCIALVKGKFLNKLFWVAEFFPSLFFPPTTKDLSFPYSGKEGGRQGKGPRWQHGELGSQTHDAREPWGSVGGWWWQGC